MKLPKTVNICGKTYTITRNSNDWGGSCSTGKQEIVVSSARDQSQHRKLTTFIHEVMEAVMLERNFRYEAADGDMTFVMNHKQFTVFAIDVTTALKDIIDIS